MEFGQNKKSDVKDSVDVNKPIENPDLKKSFELFESNKSENNLKTVLNELVKANFLVLVITDEMKISNNGKDNENFVEKGSSIKFLNCYDQNQKPFLPIFTDWQEADLWLKKRDINISAFIMTTIEAFEFATNSKVSNGVIINPGSIGWEMNKEQLRNFIRDYK
jgi:hypothetical protein